MIDNLQVNGLLWNQRNIKVFLKCDLINSSNEQSESLWFDTSCTYRIAQFDIFDPDFKCIFISMKWKKKNLPSARYFGSYSSLGLRMNSKIYVW